MSLQCVNCGLGLSVEPLSPGHPTGDQVPCRRCQSPIHLGALTRPFIDPRHIQTLEPIPFATERLNRKNVYSLIVLNGKKAGAVLPLDRSRVTIGRSGCDIVLDDPELSRKHAILAIHGETATLEDLNSTNGTFVDERRVRSARLDDRSEFRIGRLELVFVVDERESAGEARPFRASR